MWWLAAIEVIARNDGGATRSIFVQGTINRVIAALDAGAFIGGFNKLDVVLVSSADASLRVAPASSTTTGIVLTATIPRVQTGECAWPDATSELSIAFPCLAISSLESHIRPEVGGQ